ncbi:MAG: hypothetical protein ACFE8L_06400 [Candidatus Hodarchaeota archaeon]
MANFVGIKSLQSVQSPTYSTDQSNINLSPVVTYTIPWLKNSNFSSQESWETQIEGDSRDAVAFIGEEQGNYQIIGNSGVFTIDDPLSDTDWTVFNNPELPMLPDIYEINSSGCYVYHEWHENVDPTRNRPSIHWKRTITMPVNMTDYEITAASLEVIFNATVTVSPHDGGGIDRLGDGNLDDYSIGDYTEFYVLLSDVEQSFEPIQAAYNNTAFGDLGQDTPAVSNFSDTPLNPVPENVLISILTSVLGTDGYNFTITLGIDIYCEDNEYGVDIDRWNSLIIRSFNLTFSYEKKIDEFTSVSFYQQANSITGNYTQIINATLNFKYKIDQAWPTILSPNSEMRVLINANQHFETIELSSATTSFQPAKLGGFNVTYLIQKEVNLSVSIQTLIANTFSLDRNITISIDDVYLIITYSSYVPPSMFFESSKQTIIGYDYFILLGVIGMITAIFMRKKLKDNKRINY